MKNKIMTIFLFVISFLMLTSGCEFFDKTNSKKTKFKDYNTFVHVDKVKEDIDSVKGLVKLRTDNIIKDANTIKHNANNVKISIPVEIKQRVQEYIKNIENKASNQVSESEQLNLEVQNKLNNANLELQEAKSKLKKQESILNVAIEERDDAVKARDEAIKEKNQVLSDNAAKTREMLIWVMIAGIGIIAVGGVLAFYGNVKSGIALAIGGGIVSALSIMLNQYLEWIALGVLVLVILAIAVLVYHYIIRDKALDETVATAEMAKRRLSPHDRMELFGHREQPGLIDSTQSKLTKNLVLKSRKRMKSKWDHVYKDADAAEMDEYDRELRKVRND